ncbi:MAG: GNAT family N-acetyltransferase [Chloroflexi bacterium]|nr:GNAT family N-acetyltransferase [Chloroflexota bacterium]
MQEALTRAGSLQQFGPIPLPVVERAARQGHVTVAEADGALVGGVFLEPLSAEQSAAWGIPQAEHWFLSKLMIDPEQRGQGWGSELVAALQRQIGARRGGIVLDCWAGNVRLRRLYEGLGFRLHGEFDEEDYRIAVYVWEAGR